MFGNLLNLKFIFSTDLTTVHLITGSRSDFRCRAGSPLSAPWHYQHLQIHQVTSVCSTCRYCAINNEPYNYSLSIESVFERQKCRRWVLWGQEQHLLNVLGIISVKPWTRVLWVDRSTEKCISVLHETWLFFPLASTLIWSKTTNADLFH